MLPAECNLPSIFQMLEPGEPRETKSPHQNSHNSHPNCHSLVLPLPTGKKYFKIKVNLTLIAKKQSLH